MTRVLVVWEDRHYEALSTFARRRLRANASRAEFPVLLFHTSNGNGAFGRYAESTWPRARASGLPGDPKPIDHVVFVADGDRLSELPLGTAPPPQDPAQIDEWHGVAEATWTEYLRARSPDSVPRETVHGVVLRWSKESLLLAGFDRPPTAEHLKIDVSRAGVSAFLRSCSPDPSTVEMARFSNAFRRPPDAFEICKRRVSKRLSPKMIQFSTMRCERWRRTTTTS